VGVVVGFHVFVVWGSIDPQTYFRVGKERIGR
jgi:hypothetical protein